MPSGPVLTTSSGHAHLHLLRGDSTLAEIDQLRVIGVTEVIDESVESGALRDEVTDRHHHADESTHLVRTTEKGTTVDEIGTTMTDDDQEVPLIETEIVQEMIATIDETTEIDVTIVMTTKNEQTARIEKVRLKKTPQWTSMSKKNS